MPDPIVYTGTFKVIQDIVERLNNATDGNFEWAEYTNINGDTVNVLCQKIPEEVEDE